MANNNYKILILKKNKIKDGTFHRTYEEFKKVITYILYRYIFYHSICNSVELFCTTAISDKTDSVVLCEDTELRWDVSMCIVFKIHRDADVSTRTLDSSLIPFDLSRCNSLWSTMF